MERLAEITFEAGFAPDAGTMTPGVLTDCINMVPGVNGMRSVPRPAHRSADASALVFTSQDIRGHLSFEHHNFKTRTADLVGTETKLWWRTADQSATQWYDVTPASPALTNVDVWSFLHFGNDALAAAGNQHLMPDATRVMKAAVSSLDVNTVDFAEIASAPAAMVLCSAAGFAMAFNCSATHTIPKVGGGTVTPGSTSWACSKRFDASDWTIDPATLANTGKIVDPPGMITAAVEMHDDVVVFKERGMVRGRFIPGDKEVWRWQKLPFNVGCVGPRAVAKIDDGRIAFMDLRSCYIFNGTQLIDVLQGRAREWFQSLRGVGYSRGRFYSVHFEEATGNIWFNFPLRDPASPLLMISGKIVSLVYNIHTDRIGRVEMPADIMGLMVDPIEPTRRCMGFFDSTNRSQWGLSPTSTTTIEKTGIFANSDYPKLVTRETGSEWDLVNINGVRLMLTEANGTTPVTTLSLITRDDIAASATGLAVATKATGSITRFDVHTTVRLHRVSVEFDEMVELNSLWMLGNAPAGRRY